MRNYAACSYSRDLVPQFTHERLEESVPEIKSNLCHGARSALLNDVVR